MILVGLMREAFIYAFPSRTLGEGDGYSTENLSLSSSPRSCPCGHPCGVRLRVYHATLRMTRGGKREDILTANAQPHKTKVGHIILGEIPMMCPIFFWRFEGEKDQNVHLRKCYFSGRLQKMLKGDRITCPHESPIGLSI